MATEKIYLNNRCKGERPDAYGPGKNQPVYLGDVLDNHYHIFRKLESGHRYTVWLARDKRNSERSFVAIKVFSADSTQVMPTLTRCLGPLNHPGKSHAELPLRSFMVRGPMGDHLCKTIEPVGSCIYGIIDEAYKIRGDLNEQQSTLHRVLEGDPWSADFARRACWQMLLGVDYCHQQRIAHRSVAPWSAHFVLDHDLSTLSENELLKDVWPSKKSEGVDENRFMQGTAVSSDTQVEASSKPDDCDDNDEPDESDESDESDDGSIPDWQKDWEECERRIAKQWETCDPSDATAEPHSAEWKKANFFNSRSDIELLQRKDGKPLGPDEVHYTVAPTPLYSGFPLKDVANPEKPFRLVLADPGSTCAFEDCEKCPLTKISNYLAPEALLGLPTTEKGDIYSMGIVFWEFVMLRLLVESNYSSQDPEHVNLKNRQLRDIAHRLGPIPTAIRTQWRDAEKFVDSEGNALDMQEQDGETYGPDDFEYGDIWYQARKCKPLDMSEETMEHFVRLVQTMMQWQPELRPSTTQLLQDPWFKDLREKASL
ncbi:uncharacterized protein JN550_009808 [Neoarthrinium moseri]|uniref:uncharacterized protein n=1 Tax=Neoarthrinium moseri TaxID=1658444 RepID=UPI001FDB2CC0|nr:uncharacterized protein JN550_009808 [Neoarthrinium moseri]KAI1863072.1 hypothetical protein JN550_009808 [Neoarthrinium moseri]